jgi:alpha/beta hydrolase fold
MRLLALLALFAVVWAPPEAPVPLVPTLADVAYGPYAEPDAPHSAERLDFYGHPEAEAPQPVLIELHGGGFSAGMKSEFSMYLPDDDGVDAISKVFDAGFAVVSLDYPLAAPLLLEDGQPNPEFPKNDFPRGARSVRRAIQFVRSKAGEWNIDPERIFLLGNSAGGNLGLWAAMTKDIGKPKSKHPVASQSSRPDGVVFLWTATSLEPQYIVAPPDEPQIQEYLGKKSPQALAKAQKLARRASPAWRATHKGGGSKTSAELAQLNATIPLLGMYSGLIEGAGSSSYSLPVANPHEAVFGVLMQEAFDADSIQPPLAQWADFTLLDVDHEDEGAAADAMLAWLQQRAAMP